MKNQENDNLKIKLGNIKSTGGLVKYATISGYIKPNKLETVYDERVQFLKEKLNKELKSAINGNVFVPNKTLTELSIKDNRLSTKKPTFFYFEFYLRLKDETLLESRDLIRDELNILSKKLIDSVFEPNLDFTFQKTVN